MTKYNPNGTVKLRENQYGIIGVSQGKLETENPNLPKFIRPKRTWKTRALEAILLTAATWGSLYGAHKLIQYADKRNGKTEQEKIEPTQEEQAPERIRYTPQPNSTEKQIETILENEKKQEAGYDIKWKPATYKGTIILDAGHGMSNRTKGQYDPGAVSGNFQEATVVLNQALKVKEYLETNGYKVHLTRDDKTDSLPLGKRNTRKADAFVSLHYNASTSDQANGTEVLYRGTKSKGLANYIQNAIVKTVNTRDRGIKERTNLRVLKGKAPAVIVETGFLSNEGDRNKTLNTYADEQAIANGIDLYIKSTKTNYSKK